VTKVVVPYVHGMLRWETVDALEEWAGVLFHEVDEYDGYARLLIDLWEAGEAFAIVEQDVAVPPGWLVEFDACPHPWCTRAPEARPGLDWLGCARFAAPLLADHPTLMAAALADTSADGDEPYTWRKCDVRLARHLRLAHVAPHQHVPCVTHHHPVTPGRQPW
jgi:hypothetical protein